MTLLAVGRGGVGRVGIWLGNEAAALLSRATPKRFESRGNGPALTAIDDS